jgi:hypothetical protein
VNDYQNITLALPKEILIKVKHIAIDRQTSVTGLLVKMLEEMVQREDAYEKAKRSHVESLNNALPLNINGVISWKRNDIHER